jgi:predicted NBD/HSP70 family sugar kinase
MVGGVSKAEGVLLRHVHVSGPLTRAALAERMGVNRSTVLALTSRLARAGLVSEHVPLETGRVGRPSLVVAPAADRVYALAFDVAVDRLTAARVALGGQVLARRSVPRSRAGADLEVVVEALASMGTELRRTSPPGAACVGVGASYCGMVRRADGMVRYGPDLGWVDQAFGASLGARLGLGLPVAVGNEAHLGAMAEHVRGSGAGLSNLIYLHGDVGVGGGIIVGGKLLDGDGGYGCELGHMLVNPYDGRPCSCGSRGCLEAEVGERALLDAAGRPADRIGRDAVRSVIADAAAGDRRAAAAVRSIGDWLGIGVANLINLFNPGLLIFGGMMSDVYQGAADRVRARIASSVLPVSRERVRLGVPLLGDDTTLAGAADLAFTDLLADPLSFSPLAVRAG